MNSNLTLSFDGMTVQETDAVATPDDVQFASAAALVASSLGAYRRAEIVSVSDYAAQHRFLNNRGGGYVGRWNHDVAPYLVGPMEALNSSALTTAIVGPARSGKTTVGQNWLLQSVEIDPADMLVYAPTGDVLESYVKAEIEPMIDLHPIMRDRLSSLPKYRSLSFKRFQGMSVQFLPTAYSNLINKSAPRIIITELDACDAHGQETYHLADIRRTTFGPDSMVLAEGHPDLAGGLSPDRWNSGIMKLYRSSDRRTWWWPCPHCNAFSSPTPGATRETTLNFNPEAPLDEIFEQAALLCPSCGGLIEDKQRRFMNQDGFWAASGQTVSEDGTVSGEALKSDIAGFWITGIMSPFLMGGLGGLARSIAQAARDYERTGDDHALREATVKRAGIPYTPPKSIRSVDAEALAMREDASLQLGRVPAGVRYLTAAVDVQSNRFELMVRGWGENQESWVIAYEQIPANPSQSLEDWKSLITNVMTKAWPLSDGSGRGMKILGMGYDSGGEEGVTAQAYDAWRWAKRSRLCKYPGTVDGRPIFTVLPLKGMGQPNAPWLQVRFPDSQRAKTLQLRSGDVPLGQFSANRFKDKVSSSLLITEPGPSCVHFPAGLGERDDFYSQLAAEERDPAGRWHKRQGQRRNEAWDLMVMTDAMSSLFGGYKLDWEAPPTWALPWENGQNDNVLVVSLEQAAHESAPTAQKATPNTAARKAELARQAREAGSNMPATFSPSQPSAPLAAVSRPDDRKARMARLAREMGSNIPMQKGRYW